MLLFYCAACGREEGKKWWCLRGKRSTEAQGHRKWSKDKEKVGRMRVGRNKEFLWCCVKWGIKNFSHSVCGVCAFFTSVCMWPPVFKGEPSSSGSHSHTLITSRNPDWSAALASLILSSIPASWKETFIHFHHLFQWGCSPSQLSQWQLHRLAFYCRLGKQTKICFTFAKTWTI